MSVCWFWEVGCSYWQEWSHGCDILFPSMSCPKKENMHWCKVLPYSKVREEIQLWKSYCLFTRLMQLHIPSLAPSQVYEKISLIKLWRMRGRKFWCHTSRFSNIFWVDHILTETLPRDDLSSHLWLHYIPCGNYSDCLNGKVTLGM